MYICVLYHRPNSDDSIDTSLCKNMDQLLSSHPNSLFLICGDFNCHHASWLGVGTSLTCHGTSAKAFCDSLGLTQSINFPTRISTNGTPSLLDLILTNFPDNICCSSSAPIGSSDHVLVKVDISLAIIREPPHRRRWSMPDRKSEPYPWTYHVLLTQSVTLPCSPNSLPMVSKAISTHGLQTSSPVAVNVWP